MNNDSPQSDPLLGKVVSERYRVLERIGHGGFGAVYKVQHVRLDKTLALKVLFEQSHQNPRMIKRFEREARATCRIGHENIVEITDFARDAQVGYYFVMEFLDGETLADRLKKLGPLESGRLANIGAQLADALAATHGKGIVHRDLKPDNIFLIRRKAEHDFIKILDFGIAAMGDLEAQYPRLTRHGQMLGTPAYMSPEQADGLPPDQRSDIYSLGIILYELATGRVPFRNAASMAVLEMHKTATPVAPRESRPDLPISAELEQIILRALRKNVAQRYQSMRELYNDLITLVPSQRGELRVDGPPEPARDDIETEEPEWLDEDLVLLDDDDPGPTLQFDHVRGAVGPVEVVLDPDDPGPTLGLERSPAPLVEATKPVARPAPVVRRESGAVVRPSAARKRPSGAPVRPSPTSRDHVTPVPSTNPQAGPRISRAARARVHPSGSHAVARTDRVNRPKTGRHSKPKKKRYWLLPAGLIVVGFAGTLGLYALFSAIHTPGSGKSAPADPAPHAQPVSDPVADSVGPKAPQPTVNDVPNARPAAPSPARSPAPPVAVKPVVVARAFESDAGRQRRRSIAPVPPVPKVRAMATLARLDRRQTTELETAYISFASTPPGAAVMRDGTSLGTTPFELALPLGDPSFKVTFELDGHRAAKKSIATARSTTAQVSLKKRRSGGKSPAGGSKPTKRRGSNGYDLF
ncbi:MAG: serine/threonine protein kinase [Myxococcota bacterium]